MNAKLKNYLQDFDFRENFKSLTTNVKGDLLGGLTTAIIALPAALAFGVSSGLGAEAGIIGAIVLGFLAAVFGGTPSQISGPTAPMTIIVAAIVVQYTNQPMLIFGTIALAGIFQIILGITKVGRYIQYMPYPVVSGFMSGIGIIILLTQINPFLGLGVVTNVEAAVKMLPYSFANLNIAAACIGLLTILLIYLLPKLHKFFPSAIVAIIVATVITRLLRLDVPTIGDIPLGSFSFHKPAIGWDALKIMIGPALTLAVMGLIDSLLTSLVADRFTKQRHNSNRELIGQGIGNCVSGLFGGVPGAGATIRTEINILNGGRTPLSGIIYSIVFFVFVLFLGHWLKDVPLACLAAVLFKAAIDIIDFKTLKKITKFPLFDDIVLMVVLVLTAAINIMVAVGIGLLLACVLFVKRMGDLLAIDVVSLNDIEKHWVADESWRQALTKHEKGKILVFQMNGPLFFGASSNFLKSAERHGDFAGLILRMHRVPEIDVTGAYALEELVDLFHREGKFLFISGLPEEPKQFLRKLNVMDAIGEESFFRRFDEAANYATNLIRKENI